MKRHRRLSNLVRMEVRFGVHWWRFGTDVADVDQVLDSITGVSGGDFGPVEPRGAYNQPTRYLHTSGAAVYFGSQVQGQPIVVDVPGEACEQLAADDLSTWAGNLGGRVTRCDVAADLEPAGEARARLLELRDTFRRGLCDTRIPHTSTRFYESDQPGEGCTLYVGSMQSECMLRAYDRRGPLRLEWQWKPQERIVRACVGEALERYGAAGIWRKLGDRCVWPLPWYRELMAGRCAEIATAPTRPDVLAKTIAAIRDQLGPTIAGLRLLGLTIDDLAKMPGKPNAEQVRKFEAFCEQAPELGYDPRRLRAEVKRWRRKSK